LKEAEAALKLASGFAPAAVLAARLHDENGKTQRGAKALEQAFADAPQTALIQAHINLYADEPADKRAEKLQRIIDRAPASREAKIAEARRHIVLADHKAAIDAIEPVLIETATARECAIMAEAVGGAFGEAAARPWLKRAAAAPRDPGPGADGFFHYTREGWARLVREYMDYGRLSPPPLEQAPLGISPEEIKLLLAPPAPSPSPKIESVHMRLTGGGASVTASVSANVTAPAGAAQGGGGRKQETDAAKDTSAAKQTAHLPEKTENSASPEDSERAISAAREVN